MCTKNPERSQITWCFRQKERQSVRCQDTIFLNGAEIIKMDTKRKIHKITQKGGYLERQMQLTNPEEDWTKERKKRPKFKKRTGGTGDVKMEVVTDSSETQRMLMIYFENLKPRKLGNSLNG